MRGTPAGLHLGTTGAYKVDLIRARRTIARITRGLFRKEMAERLPLYPIEIFANDEKGCSDNLIELTFAAR